MDIVIFAFRNLIAAGIRTWLNTFVLTLTLLVMIILQGLYNGMLKQMSDSRIKYELGQSQLWHKDYDPYDPLSLSDSHGPIPKDFRAQALSSPILIVPAAAYHHGRIQPIVLKGIEPKQQILEIPTTTLGGKTDDPDFIPVLLGKRMASRLGVAPGDNLTIRWRTQDGAFDAVEITVAKIFHSEVPAIDLGQIWLNLATLQRMFGAQNHATIIVFAKDIKHSKKASWWSYKSLDDLLSDTYKMVNQKKSGGSFLYLILLFLAMIAIFDTQALSIFKRKREIGILMALGYTPKKVSLLFTIEGIAHGILALFFAIIIGTPLCYYLATTGMPLLISGEEFGLALADRIRFHFSLPSTLGSTIAVFALLIIISYMPTRKIARLTPTKALRGN